MRIHRFIRLIQPIVLCASVMIVLALGGAYSDAWALPVQSSLGQSTVRLIRPDGTPVIVAQPTVPNEATTAVVSPWSASTIAAGSVTIMVPEEAIIEPGTIVVVAMEAVEMPSTPAGVIVLSSMEISFYDANGQLIEQPQFNREISICFPNIPSEDSAALAIQYFDEQTKQWMPLPRTASQDGICAATTHFTLFALFKPSPANTLLQPGTGQMASDTQLRRLLIETPGFSVLLGVLLLIGIGLLLRRRLRQQRL